MSYHNTNNETGTVLEASQKKAVTQEEKIMEYFHLNPNNYYSCEGVQRALFSYTDTPITSVRRAMTNLAIKGRLTKTDKMITGQYGKKIHTWKLRIEYKQGNLFD